MTIPRMVGLLMALTAIGLAVVSLRTDQSRRMRHIQELQNQHKELRQQIWMQEMELARLRSPQMIRERAARFGLEAGIQEPAPAVKPVRR